MLLNHYKLLLIGLILLSLIPFSYAELCEVDRTKDILQKNAYLYITDPSASPLTLDEIKDLLIFYLGIPEDSITADCSAAGSITSLSISEIINTGDAAPDTIPTCSDGSKYGDCASTKPKYCSAGTLIDKCGSCGCPAGNNCINDSCVAANQNIRCSNNLDCGYGEWVSGYFCVDNSVTHTYSYDRCLNPGTASSSCILSTSNVTIVNCLPYLKERCVDGKVNCEIINETADTQTIPNTSIKIVGGIDFGTTDFSASQYVGVNSVYVSGNYAYVGLNQVNVPFKVVDVSNPSNPVEVGKSTGFGPVNAIEVGNYDSYPYIGGNVLTVLNLTIPSNIRKVSETDGITTINSIFVSGNYAYLGTDTTVYRPDVYQDYDSGFSTFSIFDITNPLIPVKVSNLKSFVPTAYSIYVDGNYAYVGTDDAQYYYYNNTLVNKSDSANVKTYPNFKVFDVSNPSNPVIIGGYQPGDSQAKVFSVYVSGKYVYLGTAVNSKEEFWILDISNPSIPTLAGKLKIGNSINSIQIVGKYAYAGLRFYGGTDFVVIDVSNPSSPKEVDGVELGSDVKSVFILGNYAYLGLSSGVANRQDLVIADISKYSMS